MGDRARRGLLDRRRERGEHRGEHRGGELGQVAVGITNTTHFLRSLAAGRVLVEATALNQGRSQQLWRVDITDESGRLVAHGEVRLQNIAVQPDERETADNG